MSRSSEWRVAVVGASGELGRRIVEALAFETHVQIVATSRDAKRLVGFDAFPNVEKRELDLNYPELAARKLRDCEAIVFCPILTLSVFTAQALRDHGNDARFVMFSSNNVGLDQTSDIYRQLRECEELVSAMPLPWALIRPTMIYGAPHDGNLGRLMRMARKTGLIAMPGKGKALQQPIHYDDLASLAEALLLDMDWRRLEIGAAGAEIASLEDIYERIAGLAGRKCRIVRLPLGLMSLPIRLLERIGLRLPLKSEQLDRIEIDKLPTWPNWDGWEPGVDLDEGLCDLAEQIDDETHAGNQATT